MLTLALYSLLLPVQPQDLQQRHRPGGADLPGGAVGPGHPRLPAPRRGPAHGQPLPGGRMGLPLRR